MIRAAAVVLLSFALLAASASASPARGDRVDRFVATVQPIGPALRATMTGVSWRRGCPVGLDGLRVIRATHWGFDGRVRTGRLVVARTVAPEVVRALRALFAARFPIRRMVPIDTYGGNDFRSIEADNTSAFNCRVVDGTTRWSNHAYGTAIDLNPIENPYVTASGSVAHRASRPYVARSPVRPGMAVEGGAAVAAFDAIGWGWGGRWSGDRDYQHFSADGR